MTNGTSLTHNNVGNVRVTDITSEMQGAYLDYAMSVIVSRALPDVRDGLKPVHRRILYAMYHDLGLTAHKPHKKSARIVGEVLGKYHPHGDTAVYDAMVRMAQPFSLRYPLVDGQGNFGSVDGDGAAAMRYTEARLDIISDLMLTDLEKDTVDWHDNFDNTLLEPDILPAALPNLLINGSSGIAVGMATNIPPHNLAEVVDALVYMIDNQARIDKINVEQLMRFIQGPDFPTGGTLYRYRVEGKDKEDLDAITQGYSVGKARLIVQAKAHFEEMSRNRSRIVITELPYQTNKATLIERIASLVRDGKIEGITDLRDESDRTGMRVVIELTRNVEPKEILADLFKYTPLQQTFGMQMLALVNGQPRLLGLKRMLQLFIEHRQVVIRRRSEYDLARAKARAHILEGLLKALDILDEVIATIRASQRVESARTNLMRNFKFSQLQAQAILDMQLRRLAALERKRLQDEYNEILKQIKYLEDLLANPGKILQVIKEDLLAIRADYGDARRTQIVDRTKGTLTSTDLLPEQDVWVSVANSGDLRRQNVSRISKSTMRQVAKGSQIGLFTANTRDQLYLFGNSGQCRRLSIHEIPQNGTAKHLAELTEFSRRDSVLAATAIPRLDKDQAGGYLFCATELGIVKRVTLADFLAAAGVDPQVMSVDAKDRLTWVFPTTGTQDIVMVSSAGKAIRFAESDVRSMGLAAGGVGGMKLKKNERIVYAGVVDAAGELITATEKGYAKRTPLGDYSRQGRNGGGIVTHKLSTKTGNVTAALAIPPLEAGADEAHVALVSVKDKVNAFTIDEIPAMGRGVQGRQIMAITFSDAVAAVQRLTSPAEGATTEIGSDGATASGGAVALSSANGRKAPRATNGKGASARKGSTTKAAPARTPAPAKAKRSSASEKASSTTTKRSSSKPVNAKVDGSERKATASRGRKSSSTTSTKSGAGAKAKEPATRSKTARRTKRTTPAPEATPTKKRARRRPVASQSPPSQRTTSQRTTSQRTTLPEKEAGAKAPRKSKSKAQTTTKSMTVDAAPAPKPTPPKKPPKRAPKRADTASPQRSPKRTEQPAAKRGSSKTTTTRAASRATSDTGSAAAKRPKSATSTNTAPPASSKSGQRPAAKSKSKRKAKLQTVASVTNSQKRK